MQLVTLIGLFFILFVYAFSNYVNMTWNLKLSSCLDSLTYVVLVLEIMGFLDLRNLFHYLTQKLFFLFVSQRSLFFCHRIFIGVITVYIRNSHSWEADSSLAGQGSPRMLNRKFHDRVRKSSPLVLILSKINPFHPPTYYFSKTYFNITLPSTPMFSMWSPSLRFPQ